eukprot:scaffold11232_cov100-Isochrysis_galbana.AAC.1
MPRECEVVVSRRVPPSSGSIADSRTGCSCSFSPSKARTSVTPGSHRGIETDTCHGSAQPICGSVFGGWSQLATPPRKQSEESTSKCGGARGGGPGGVGGGGKGKGLPKLEQVMVGIAVSEPSNLKPKEDLRGVRVALAAAAHHLGVPKIDHARRVAVPELEVDGGRLDPHIQVHQQAEVALSVAGGRLKPLDMQMRAHRALAVRDLLLGLQVGAREGRVADQQPDAAELELVVAADRVGREGDRDVRPAQHRVAPKDILRNQVVASQGHVHLAKDGPRVNFDPHVPPAHGRAARGRRLLPLLHRHDRCALAVHVELGRGRAGRRQRGRQRVAAVHARSNATAGNG